MEDLSDLTVGQLADTVPGSSKRTVGSVTGRLIEEVVELCLCAGLTPEQIQGHVMDSIYNQYVKVSSKFNTKGGLIYPSTKLSAEVFGSIADEVADVRIMLDDVCHLAKVDLEEAYDAKMTIFKTKIETGQFYANHKGLLYVRKPHMDVGGKDTENEPT